MTVIDFRPSSLLICVICIWPMRLQSASCLLHHPKATVAVSKGKQAVKLCSNKLLQFLTGVAGRPKNGCRHHCCGFCCNDQVVFLPAVGRIGVHFCIIIREGLQCCDITLYGVGVSKNMAFLHYIVCLGFCAFSVGCCWFGYQ